MAKRQKTNEHEDEGDKHLQVWLLGCHPGCFQDNGCKGSFITIGGREFVQAMALDLKDSQQLAVRLLASLWTAGDEFAGKVLQEMFVADSDGLFQWPSGSEG